MNLDRLRHILALGVIAGFWLPAVASAQGPKIAFVDTTRAAANSKAGKEADQALSSLRDQKRGEFGPKEQALKQLQEEYETQRFVLSKTALQERELELLKKRRDLERDLAAATEEFEIEQRKLMQPILQSILQAVGQLAKEQGYDVILEKTSPGVLFYSDTLDITDLVIARLNEKG